MKKIAIFLVALTVLLSACSTNRQNGDPASASSPSESSQSITDAPFLPAEQLARETGEIVQEILSDDFDGDGRPEAFALAGADQDGLLTLWFVDEDGVLRLSDESSIGGARREGETQLTSYRLDGERFCIVCEAMGGSATSSSVYLLEGGKPVRQSNLDGTMGFIQAEGNAFTALHSAYDAGYDLIDGDEAWSGHTWKPYWFFWNGTAFEEYAGTAAGLEELKAYDGAVNLVEDALARRNKESFPLGGVDFDGVIVPVQWEVQSIYQRDNGIINVNYGYDYFYEQAQSGGGARLYDTFQTDGSAITLVDSGSGSYLPAMTEPLPSPEPSVGGSPAAGTVLKELPVMTDEMAEYYHKYIPFSGSSGIPLGTDFDEEHYFSARTYFLFHYAYGLEHGDFDFLGSTADLYQSSGYPAELVEGTIREYFLFDVDELRAAKEYREADAVYYFEGGYGGGYYEPVVVAARQNGDLLELDIEQYGDLYTSGDGFMLERSNTLTLRLESDGGWKYIANKVTYQLQQ